MKLIKKCKVCEKVFEKKINCSKKEWAKSKFCSRACQAKGRVCLKGRGGFKKGNLPWNKGMLGLQLNTGRTHIKKGQRLSPKTEFKKGIVPKTCFKKGDPLISERNRIKKGKPLPSIQGSKHPNWKGGTTKPNRLARKSIEFKTWREKVFIRDNHTCQKCKVRGGDLHPHHIENFSDNLELRYVLSNGITLHKKCHKEFHKLYGHRNNTREQIDSFIATI